MGKSQTVIGSVCVPSGQNRAFDLANEPTDLKGIRTFVDEVPEQRGTSGPP